MAGVVTCIGLPLGQEAFSVHLDCRHSSICPFICHLVFALGRGVCRSHAMQLFLEASVGGVEDEHEGDTTEVVLAHAHFLPGPLSHFALGFCHT